MASEREKFLKNMQLEGEPEVRSHIHIWYQVWEELGESLKWLEEFSPYVSVSIDRKPRRAAGSEATDIWGCHWVYPLESHDGQCMRHPIAHWSDLRTYQPPDPDKHTDWKQAEKNVQRARSEGKVAYGGTDHGFIFLRLTYLRGFSNLMMDIADRRSELDELVEMVSGYWFKVVKRWVELGVDAITFGDDLGLQDSLPMSPEAWREYIKPAYRRSVTRFTPAPEGGALPVV